MAWPLILAGAAIGGLQFGSSSIKANSKRRQAVKIRGQEQRMLDAQRAQQEARLNRENELIDFQNNEMHRLRNYKVGAYERYIPAALRRANLAYQDNAAQLTELIDQYQFMGQDMLRANAGAVGQLAARGITGRGAQMADVAREGKLGSDNALIARNLLAARYGTQRSNEIIQQQMTDDLMARYNEVGFVPNNIPRLNVQQMLGPRVRAIESYTQGMRNADLLAGGLEAVASAAPMMAAGFSQLGKNKLPPGLGSQYSTQGIPGMGSVGPYSAQSSTNWNQGFGTGGAMQGPVFGNSGAGNFSNFSAGLPAPAPTNRNLLSSGFSLLGDTLGVLSGLGNVITSFKGIGN